jgi:intein/homing endonuclease
MKDGSEKRIDLVQVGEEVLTDESGSYLTVDDIVTGIEEKPCLRITTQTGRSLKLTDGHPIATPDGFYPANELSMGDLIKTESGLESILSITQERYLGIVYNLKLGDGLSSSGASHYANGILVGDGNKQNTVMDQRKREARKPRCIAELPEEWRFDALNAERLKEGEVLIPYIQS